MPTLNEAIPIFIGHGITPHPKEDSSRLVEKFGEKEGTQLAVEVQSLLEDLGRLKPNWDQHSLVSASQWAVAELARRYPELNAEAKAALEWAYSWWWR